MRLAVASGRRSCCTPIMMKPARTKVLARSAYCLIGNEEAWKGVEEKWIARKDEDRIKVFHSFDCRTGKKEFCYLPRPKRDLLMSDLAEVVGQSELYSVGLTVKRRDWENVTNEAFKIRYQTPYHLCFENAVIGATEWSKQHANREPVSVVFARQDEYKEFSDALIDFLMKTTMSEIVASIAISTPEKMVPLQVADLAANLTGRRFLARNRPLSPLDKKFAGNNRTSKEMLKIIDTKSMLGIVEALQAGNSERRRSTKLSAFYTRKADQESRRQRKSWGLLPTVQAAVNKIRRKAKPKD
jgi:hypothetical protein